MISLIQPEDLPTLDTADIANALLKAHGQFTEARLMDALIARFGELPSLEEIAKHCLRVIDHEGVSHFLWFDGEKPKHGEYVDLSSPLCSVAPPKIFTPEA